MKISKCTSKFLLIIFFFSLFSNSYCNENKLNDFYKTIRCLVCEGQSIQESDTELAINLKEQIPIKYNSLKIVKQEFYVEIILFPLNIIIINYVLIVLLFFVII